MEITNINKGCKAQKAEPSCRGGVLGSISVSPSSLFLVFLAYTRVPIPAPSTLSAGGHRQFPSSPFSSPSSSPCFSTQSCLSNGPHLGEIEPLSLCLSAKAELSLKAGGPWFLHPGLGLSLLQGHSHPHGWSCGRNVLQTVYVSVRGMNECSSISGYFFFSLFG